jgi:hypothetical protein
MKSFISILITSVYVAFSLGLTLHIHHCDKVININVELSQLEESKGCQEDNDYACCKQEDNEKSCCSKSNKSDKKCLDSYLLIQLQEEQLVSKKLVIKAISAEQSSETSKTLLVDYQEETFDKRGVFHPPPINIQKHILYCSLTLYG